MYLFIHGSNFSYGAKSSYFLSTQSLYLFLSFLGVGQCLWALVTEVFGIEIGIRIRIRIRTGIGIGIGNEIAWWIVKSFTTIVLVLNFLGSTGTPSFSLLTLLTTRLSTRRRRDSSWPCNALGGPTMREKVFMFRDFENSKFHCCLQDPVSYIFLVFLHHSFPKTDDLVCLSPYSSFYMHIQLYDVA